MVVSGGMRSMYEVRVGKLSEGRMHLSTSPRCYMRILDACQVLPVLS